MKQVSTLEITTMNTTLPPSAQAQLDNVKHALEAPQQVEQPQYQPPGQAPAQPVSPPPIAVPPVVEKSGGLLYWLTWPFKALLRYTALSAVAAGFIILGLALAATIGYINGSEGEKANAIKAKDELLSKFAVDLPLDIKFKQGTVESYGFFRNWLWRQAKAKEFALSATVSTTKDANTTLKDKTITQTLESGDKFQLKPGTNDVWQLVPPPEIPVPTAVK